MAILILIDTFKQGHTVGKFIGFSVVYSLVMYSNGVGAFLPWMFNYQDLHTGRASREVSQITRTPFTLIMMVLPIVICGIIIAMYFYPDRTEWLAKNGFNGLDYDPDVVRGNFIAGMTIIILLYIVFALLIFKDILHHSSFPLEDTEDIEITPKTSQNESPSKAEESRVETEEVKSEMKSEND